MSDSPEKQSIPRRGRGRPRAFNDVSDQNVIKSLDRALTLMTRLAEGGETTLTDLSDTLDEAPATLYRALFTLQKHGFADLDPETQNWQVGPDAFRVGSAFLRRTSLIEVSRPILRRLMEATGETANLGIAAGDDVLFLSQVETHETIRAFFPPGTKSPSHASGIGKALLAHVSERRLGQILSRRREAFTSKTLVEKDALLADLHKIRARGYSFDDEEKNPGMRCIAAPIRDLYGETIAGISVSGPNSRMTSDRVDGMAVHVMAAAADVSAALGFRA